MGILSRPNVPSPSLFASVLDPQGSAARSIDDLWWLMAVVGTIVFAVVAIGLVVGLRRAPDREGPDHGIPGDGLHGATRRWVVGGGVVLPVVTISLVLVATVVVMRSVTVDVEDADVVVEVTGHQWWWEVTYPDAGVVTANEVHIPARTTVLLRLRSADVIHSFWVPALAGKVDLLPERVNELVIDADEPGRYTGRCAEFCGLQHTNMGFDVVAHEPGGFEAWLADQRRPASAPVDGWATTGLAVVEQECAACHTIRGTGAGGREGPDLTHVMSRERIGAGVAPTTRDSLRSWIADPHAIKDGVLMPAAELTSDELDAVVAYVESLD